MNKYIRALYCVPCGILKIGWNKLFHFRRFSGPILCMISPCTEISLDYGGELRIGNRFKMRDGAKIRVRKGAVCSIGNNSSINSNNMIVCRDRIDIGDDVQLSPNVLIFDHDHDYSVDGGVKAGKYKTSPIKIGNNVWIGANTVILRGTEIGDNSVIGAGCVLKGRYEEGSLIIQKRENIVRNTH